MKLPDLIKKAVQTEDWGLICKAYTVITGEPLSPPEKKKVIDFASFEIPDDVVLGPQQYLVDDDDEDFEEDDKTELESSEDKENRSAIITDMQEAQSELARAQGKKKDRFVAPSRKNDSREVNEEGKVKAKRESIRIPQKGARPNRFQDDVKKERHKELLQSHNPELKKLYGEHTHRLTRDELEEGVDTSVQVDVVCSLCDTPETVAASVATGYSTDPMNNTYRCNSCSTPAGRAKAMRARRAAELQGK